MDEATPQAAPDFVHVFSPDGEIGTIPPDQLEAALTQGYRQASPADVHHAQLREDQSGVEGTLNAAGIGAADAVTFGAVSPIVQKYNPGYAEELQAAQEEHPIAGGAGTAVGLTGSLANPLLKGVTAAGTAVGDAVGAGASSVVGNTAGNAIGTVAQLGTEGALVSTPKAAAEVFTGDPEEAAETLLHGTEFGAGLGTALGAAGALPAFLKAAGGTMGTTPGASQVGDYVSDVLKKWEVGQGGRILGLNKAFLKKVGQDRAEELVDFAHDNGLLDIFQDSSDRLAQVGEMKDRFGKIIGGVFKQIDDTGKRFIDPTPLLERLQGKPWTDAEGNVHQISVPSSQLLAPERNAYEKALSDAQDVLLKKNGGLKTPTFAQIQKLKSMFGEYAYKDFAAVRPGRELVAQMERAVNQTIDESLTWAEKSVPGQQKLWTEAKSTWRNYNDLEKPLENLVASEVGNQFVRPSDMGLGIAGASAGGIPGAVGGFALNSIRHRYGGQVAYKTLNAVNGFIEGRNQAIGTSVSQFLSKYPIGDTVEAAAPATLGVLDSILPEGKGDKAEKISQLNDTFSKIVANPTRTSDLLSSFTPEVSQVSPDIAASMQQKLLEATSYLQGYIPKPIDPPNPFQKSTFRPNDQAISQFERRLQAAVNPYSMLDQLSDGTLTKESVQTVRELYPNFYNKVQETLLTKAAEKKANLPFGARLRLSLLMGTPFDASLHPDRMAALQANYAIPEAAPAPLKHKLNIAEQTGTQIGRIGAQ